MSNETRFLSDEDKATLGWQEQHALEYLRSGGTRGHLWDFTPVGGYPWLPCLLLETIGRKSGARRIAPLLYGATDGGFVIVASKGGAPAHPAWYHNIRDQDRVVIQVAAQAFSCTWREPEGADRERIWAFMADLYPPYRDYAKATDRLIPMVLMTPVEEIALLAE